MKILLYGLNEAEMQNIRDIFGTKYEIIDETGAFTDILAVQTDAVIMNPDSLTKEEKAAFSELFQYDHDTKVILNHDVWEEEKFPLCGYYCIEDLEEVNEIEPLEDKLTEKERYREAEKRMEQILERSRKLILPPDDCGMESKIALVNNQCIAFELLCSRLEEMQKLKPKEKVSFRRRLYDLLEEFQ